MIDTDSLPAQTPPFRAQSRPPVEQRAITDHVALFGKGNAAFANGLIEILNRVEAFVGERFVDKLPEMFGWLQFGAVSRLEDEPDAIGHGKFRAPELTPVRI